LGVHNGGRKRIEEALLIEFAKPGVGNLRKIKKLGEDLRPKGRLTLHVSRMKDGSPESEES
tara:strand:+ start:21754 stop:21936 length:183 start_codon:yes stop_codon:yes gene_type:complete